MALLTAEDVHWKQFQATKFREGYDQEEVDEFLDEVVETIATLQDQNASLKTELDEARQQAASGGVAPASSDNNEEVAATGHCEYADCSDASRSAAISSCRCRG